MCYSLLFPLLFGMLFGTSKQPIMLSISSGAVTVFPVVSQRLCGKVRGSVQKSVDSSTEQT